MLSGPLVALAVVVGAACGVFTDVAASEALLASLAAASLALPRRVLPARARLGLGLVALAGLAGAHAAHARAAALAPPLGAWFDEAAGGRDRLDEPVAVTGRLVADATRGPFGPRVTIDVVAIQAGHGPEAVAGRIAATVSGVLADGAAGQWTEGRVIRASVMLRRPRAWQNPGGPSVRWQTLQRPFVLAGTIKSGALVEVAPTTPWHDAAASVRRHVRRVTSRLVGRHDDQSAAIVTAILIGDRAGLDDDVERRLQAAGTYHVIAISGGNVALVTALCFLICRALFRSARASTLATIGVVAAYGWIVGGDASVTRAVMAAGVYLGFSLLGLAPRALPIVAVVAVIVVAADPLIVIDVGAWLSFGATIGIVLGASRALAWAAGSRGAPGKAGTPGTPGARGPAPESRVRRLLVAAGAVAAATLAAELALLPVAASVFARVGVAGLAVNLVAVPAMAVVQIAGAATVALGGWAEPAAAMAGRVAHLAAVALVDSARLVDVLPWISWRVPVVPLVLVLVYYAGWLVWFAAPGAGRRRLRHTALAASAAAALAIVTAPLAGQARPRAGWLRVTTIDVGQGDAVLVQFPRGHAMLVDTGGVGPSFDIGGRVVVPAVWALGTRRLDWLAITHADLDHIGGALAVVDALRPREVWEGVPVPPNSDLAALRARVADQGAVWRRLETGHHLVVDGVRVDVRHPPAPDWERQQVRNDDSLVLSLVYGDVELLLTGDAGGEFESRPDVVTPTGRLRVLKVAHHGSRTSTSRPFVARYRPDVALVSAGGGNLFGHPAPDVLRTLADARAEVFRTDRDGAILLETDGDRVEVTTMTGRRRLIARWKERPEPRPVSPPATRPPSRRAWRRGSSGPSRRGALRPPRSGA